MLIFESFIEGGWLADVRRVWEQHRQLDVSFTSIVFEIHCCSYSFSIFIESAKIDRKRSKMRTMGISPTVADVCLLPRILWIFPAQLTVDQQTTEFCSVTETANRID